VRNRAYAIGTEVLAFQFHPEAKTGDHERWLIDRAHELAAKQDLCHSVSRGNDAQWTRSKDTCKYRILVWFWI
jgi:hypothetical protein